MLCLFGHPLELEKIACLAFILFATLISSELNSNGLARRDQSIVSQTSLVQRMLGALSARCMRAKASLFIASSFQNGALRRSLTVLKKIFIESTASADVPALPI